VPIRCDVLVSGLGPAGATAALEAARRGCDVFALDRKAVLGEPVQCAEFIPMPLAGLVNVDGARVQNIGGMRAHLPSGACRTSASRGAMISRAAFDRSLAESARSEGARLWTGSRLIGLDVHAGLARINTAARVDEVAWKVLIAADGPRSTVARLMGLPALDMVLTRQYTLVQHKESVQTEVWLSPDYPGGYAWLFPKSDRANLGVGVASFAVSRLKPLLDSLHDRLHRAGKVGLTVLDRTGGAIPVGDMREHLAYRRVILAGDAAGLTHPVSGAGIASAVISGLGAGRAAADFLTGRTRALMEYDEDMHDRFGASFERALRRRQVLAMNGSKGDDDYRRAWVDFPEYYA
jgi:digeranylgeranylglycerophospholipid reductase